MALIKCPECGKEISDKAEKCLNCGCPSTEWKSLIEKDASCDLPKEFLIEKTILELFTKYQPKKTEAIRELANVCGIEIIEAKKLVDDYWGKHQTEIDEKKKYLCNNCHKQNEVGTEVCVYCGFRIKNIFDDKKPEQEHSGVFRYINGKNMELFCPYCQSRELEYYSEQKIIHGRTKAKYSANLNPLKPFTLFNKKEISKPDTIITEEKARCKKCGKIF